MKKALFSFLGKFICAFLIVQMALGLPSQRWAFSGVAYASEEEGQAGSEEVLNSDEYTEAMEGTDAAMASATPTVYDQTDINWAEQNVGGIISYLMFMIAGVTALKAAIKCPAIWAVYSMDVFMVTGIAHMLAEAINYIVFYDQISSRATAYTDKVEAYGGTDTTTQVDGLKEAKGIHEDLETMLLVKQIAMTVATAGYVAAAIIATVDAASDNVPLVGWGKAAVTGIEEGVNVAECSANMTAEGDNNKKFYEKISRLHPSYISNVLFQGSLSDVDSYFALKEWSQYQSGLSQSLSIEEYDAKKEIAHSIIAENSYRLGKSFSQVTREIAIFASNVIMPMAMASESTSESNDSSFWTAALDVVGKALVGYMLASAVAPALMTFMSAKIPRAVVLWLIAGLGATSDIFVTIEKDKVTKRIKEYDEIITALENSSTGTSVAGSTTDQTLVGQTTMQTSATLESKTAMGCVNSSFQSDPNCTCTSSNSCYSTTSLSKKSQSWSSSFPSWGSTATNNSSDLVNSLAKGDYGKASSIGGSSGKLATRMSRARAVAQSQLEKASEGKFNLRKEQTDAMKALKAKMLSVMSEQQMKDMFAMKDVVPESKGKPNANEAKNLLTGIVKLEKETAKKKGNDWKMDFGLKGLNKKGKEGEAQPAISSDQALNNYEYDAKDVHGDDVNIFDVVHSRYVRSYDRLFEKAKEVPTATAP